MGRFFGCPSYRELPDQVLGTQEVRFFDFIKASNLMHTLICARLLISDFSVFPLFQPHRAHRERFILTDALMFIYFLAEVDVYILNHQDTSVIILTDDLSTTLQDPGLLPYQIAHRPKGINFHVIHRHYLDASEVQLLLYPAHHFIIFKG